MLPPLRHPLRLAALFGALLCASAAATSGAEPRGAPLAEPDGLVVAVLQLADRRLALMPEVAASKWASGQPVVDAARESEVIAAAGDRAAAAGLDRDTVADYFAAQVAGARGLQLELHDAWRRGERLDERPPAASLAGQLRPRLDAISTATVRALYLAAPVLAATDGASRLVALADRELRPPLWDDARRASLVTALARVRLGMPRSIARARSVGVLRIGTPADYAPFAVAVDGRVEGADVRLALGLAASAGLEPVFVRSSWRGLLGDLAADRFDIAVGGISVTTARRAVAAFSRPTAHGGKSAVGACAARPRLASLAAIDRPEVVVIENRGGTNETIARELAPHAQLVVHPDNLTVFDELLAGRADAMFTDDTEIALVTRRHPQLCRLLAELYAPTDKAMLLPAEPEWRTLVDDWLGPQIERGVPASLLAEELAR
ncbi:MAG: transporter substrate-binding domain-containing protein [Proteobacteria bacterium]|nr:transporter substrate-binding domain-containing protein [Pseudomonadota bacterium]